MASLKNILCAVLAAGVLAAGFAQSTPVPGQKIRVNSVGFLPGYPKAASVEVSNGAAQTPFTVKRAGTDAEALTGTTGPTIYNDDTQDYVQIVDFSEITAAGRYYIEIGGDRSPEFDIGDDVFTDPFQVMMLGFYLWRCGSPDGVSATYKGQTFSHAACHRQDGNAQYIIGGGAKDGSGGWHDAGDYGKYMVNSGVTVALMLKAWEHYGSVLGNVDLHAVNRDGNIPKYLTEIKWNLDWVAKMQYGDNGQVAHKLTSRNHSPNIMPNLDDSTRFFVPGGTEAAGSFVGMLAQAARIYKPYSEALAAEWLEKAKTSYEWLKSNPNFMAANQSAFNTGEYTTATTSAPMKVNYDRDKRLYAAVELWETTGDSAYLSDFERMARVNELTTEIEWGEWNGVNGIAYAAYLMSGRQGKRRSLVDSLKARLVVVADSIVTNTKTHGYGRAFGGNKYYWGGHGSLTATAFLLNMAYAATGEAKYREAGHDMIGNIFGRNYFGRSFVTGVGHNPPVNTHDRRSRASNRQWPGYLIGGPHRDLLSTGSGMFSSPVAPPGAQCATHGVCYFDYANDYARNEIAINWNASMVYALAAYLPGSEPPKFPTDPVSVRNNAAGQSARIKATSRIVQFRNGRTSAVIPAGAKIYSLDGRLVAQRKAGQPAPAINRNGVFIMKVDK